MELSALFVVLWFIGGVIATSVNCDPVVQLLHLLVDFVNLSKVYLVAIRRVMALGVIIGVNQQLGFMEAVLDLFRLFLLDDQSLLALLLFLLDNLLNKLLFQNRVAQVSLLGPLGMLHRIHLRRRQTQLVQPLLLPGFLVLFHLVLEFGAVLLLKQVELGLSRHFLFVGVLIGVFLALLAVNHFEVVMGCLLEFFVVRFLLGELLLLLQLFLGLLGLLSFFADLLLLLDLLGDISGNVSKLVLLLWLLLALDFLELGKELVHQFTIFGSHVFHVLVLLVELVDLVDFLLGL